MQQQQLQQPQQVNEVMTQQRQQNATLSSNDHRSSQSSGMMTKLTEVNEDEAASISYHMESSQKQQQHQAQEDEISSSAKTLTFGRPQHKYQPYQPQQDYQQHQQQQLETYSNNNRHSNVYQQQQQHQVAAQQPMQQRQGQAQTWMQFQSSPLLPTGPLQQDANHLQQQQQQQQDEEDLNTRTSSSILEQIDLLSKDESMRFTQAQMSEPAKFIDKLERRVAVLEKIEDKKKKSESTKKQQQQKQRELQLRVKKQNMIHQKQLEKIRSQMADQNRKKAQTLRFHTKESLEQSRRNHLQQQKYKVAKLSQQFYNPQQARPDFNTMQRPETNTSYTARGVSQMSGRGSSGSLYENSERASSVLANVNNVGRLSSNSSTQQSFFKSRHGSQSGPRKHFFDTSVYSNHPIQMDSNKIPTNHHRFVSMNVRQEREDHSEDQTNRTMVKDRQTKSWNRVSVSRNLANRKDRKNLKRIQDTLRQIDHIQTLKQIESKLLYQIYGDNAERHKYRGTLDTVHPVSNSLPRNRLSPELDLYSIPQSSQRMTAYQHLSPSSSLFVKPAANSSEESTTIQLNNILVPSAFQMTGTANIDPSGHKQSHSVQIARQTAQMVQARKTAANDAAMQDSMTTTLPQAISQRSSALSNQLAPLPQQQQLQNAHHQAQLSNNTYSLFDHHQQREIPRLSQKNNKLNDNKLNQAMIPSSLAAATSQATNNNPMFSGDQIDRPQTQQSNYNFQQQQQSRAVSRGTDVSGVSFSTTLGVIDGNQYNSKQRMALTRGLHQYQPSQQQDTTNAAGCFNDDYQHSQNNASNNRQIQAQNQNQNQTQQQQTTAQQYQN